MSTTITESMVRSKIEAGESITAEEANVLLTALSASREARDRYKNRFHSAFREPFAYYHPDTGLQIICGLPLPAGAMKLYGKADDIKIPDDFRPTPGKYGRILINKDGLARFLAPKAYLPLRQLVGALYRAGCSGRTIYKKSFWSENND